MSWRPKKAIEPLNKELVDADEMEDLCSECLSVAKECYSEYNEVPEIRNEALRIYCQRSVYYTDIIEELEAKASRAVIRNVEE